MNPTSQGALYLDSRERPVFTDRETHGRALRPENRLVAHSSNAGWRSLYAAIIEEAPLNTTESGIRHPFLIYHLSHPTAVTRKISGASCERALIGPRRMCLTPPGATAQWQHSGHPEILQVYLRDTVYAAVANEMYGCTASDVELIPRFAMLDPLLEQLAIAIISALRDGSAQDGLYVDMLAQMVAVQLARHHSTRAHAVSKISTISVASWKMRRLIEFIEDHLDGDLSLGAMAAEVEISPLYLPRAFKAAIGQSPHQYVLERRIQKAKSMLTSTDIPIVDIALSLGFSSQSHLSNWFLRLVGITPATYRHPKLS